MARKKRNLPWIDWVGDVAYAFWYDSERSHVKRLSLRTSDPGEAAARFAAFLTQGQELREPSRMAGLSVTQALDDYWTEHVGEKVIDQRRQEVAIRHLKAWFRDTPIGDIDIPACRAYRDARRAGTISGNIQKRRKVEIADATIRRELQIINSAAQHAMRWKKLSRDRLPIVELPVENTLQKLGDNDWLTKDEYRRAVAASTGRLRHFMVLAYGAAARRASIEKLTRFQVNLRTGLLDLQRPDATDLERASKKRRPVVPITSEMRPVLEELMLDGDPANPWLFGDHYEMYKKFRANMERIGLGHKRNPHILRHSRATHLLMDGVPIFDVAKLLGDTIATTERVYGHYCPGYLGATIEQAR